MVRSFNCEYTTFYKKTIEDLQLLHCLWNIHHISRSIFLNVQPGVENPIDISELYALIVFNVIGTETI